MKMLSRYDEGVTQIRFEIYERAGYLRAVNFQPLRLNNISLEEAMEEHSEEAKELFDKLFMTGKIENCVRQGLFDSDWQDKGFTFIEMFEIEKKGNGTGSRAFGEILETLKHFTRTEYIILKPEPLGDVSRERLEGFYQRFGFRKIGDYMWL